VVSAVSVTRKTMLISFSTYQVSSRIRILAAGFRRRRQDSEG
jgi:hypothetical protein